MLTDSQRDFVSHATRTMQIIVASLAGGVAVFFALVLIITVRGAINAPANHPLVTYVAAGFAVTIFAIWAIVPGLVTSQNRKSIVEGRTLWLAWPARQSPGAEDLADIGPMAVAYQTRLIIAAALLEGAAFLNLIAYMLERQSLSLVIAGVLWLMLLSHVPTVSRVENWLERELTTVEQLRLMRRD
ncbi:MAG: hypothetical protein L0Z07_03340 [Planctomycetes bacterium]|nr:hypothetical protein [Planctomycetota bacterium]